MMPGADRLLGDADHTGIPAVLVTVQGSKVQG